MAYNEKFTDGDFLNALGRETKSTRQVMEATGASIFTAKKYLSRLTESGQVERINAGTDKRPQYLWRISQAEDKPGYYIISKISYSTKEDAERALMTPEALEMDFYEIREV